MPTEHADDSHVFDEPAPPEPLDGPPSTDVGRIVDIDTEHREILCDSRSTKECQHCGEAVTLREMHVKAFVVVENAIGMASRSPVFCDASCWARWATAR